MRTLTGYWVVDTPEGRRQLPVTFYFDSYGNLVGMRDPYGGIRQFETTISSSSSGHVFSANACDYFIATVPTERWVPVDPYRWGFVDAQGRVWPLNHSIADICQKRADVCEYIARTYGVPTPYAPASKAQAVTPTIQAPRYVGCGTIPSMRVSQACARLDQYALGAGVINLIEQFTQAMLAFAPPGFREAFNLAWQEGLRQENIITSRLSKADLEWYYKARQAINQAHTEGRISDEEFHKLHRMVYQAALQKAGLREEELLTSSPYMRPLAEQVSRIPGASQVATAITQKIERTKQLEQLRALITSLPLDRKQYLAAKLAEYLRSRGQSV